MTGRSVKSASKWLVSSSFGISGWYGGARQVCAKHLTQSTDLKKRCDFRMGMLLRRTDGSRRSSFDKRSLAFGVRRRQDWIFVATLAFKIFSIVFLRLPPVNGGYISFCGWRKSMDGETISQTKTKMEKKWRSTAPLSISKSRVPKLQ